MLKSVCKAIALVWAACIAISGFVSGQWGAVALGFAVICAVT